jgi:hypothetical protein
LQRFGPEFERDVERSVEQSLRNLPEQIEPLLNFRFDGGIPAMGARGRLGVQVEGLSDQLATYFGVADGGVLVAGVTADSPAAKAGVKAGDVITKVNGEAVKDRHRAASAVKRQRRDAHVVRDRKATSSRPRRTGQPSRPARAGRPCAGRSARGPAAHRVRAGFRQQLEQRRGCEARYRRGEHVRAGFTHAEHSTTTRRSCRARNQHRHCSRLSGRRGKRHQSHARERLRRGLSSSPR